VALSPEGSVMSGLAVAGVVYSIHSNFTPDMADIAGLPAGNADIDKSERQATWLSIGIVSGISLLAKDPTIFVIGSVATVAMALMTRHASWTESATGMVGMGDAARSAVSADDTAAGPQMSDTTPYPMFGSEFVSS
jgi:hypothetical protein